MRLGWGAGLEHQALLSQPRLEASRVLFGERPSEVCKGPWLLQDDRGQNSWEMVRNHR